MSQGSQIQTQQDGPDNWDQYQTQFYKNSGGMDEYEFVSGVCEIPKAEMPPTDPELLKTWSPVIIVRMHAPYWKKKVWVKSTKNGSPPVMPKPASVGAMEFMGGTLVYHQPQMDTTLGNYDWTAMCSYEFVLNCRGCPDDGFVLTNQPYTSSIQNDNLFDLGPGQPQYGAVAQAGNEAKTGWQVGQTISLANPNYTYTIPGYVPAIFLNSDMLNGVVQTTSG